MTCAFGAHARPASDYLGMRGRQYGVGPRPHGDLCGTASDQQVEERQQWMHRLLDAIDRSKTGALIDKEQHMLAGFRLRYGRLP